MIWEDSRAAGIIESNTLSDPTYICQAWCSTEQGTDILLEELGVPSNASGQATCCDNVFVPGSIAQNVIGYDVQVMLCAYTWQLCEQSHRHKGALAFAFR